MKHIFVKQDGIKDCGISCLLMIIRTHKGGCSKEYLRELAHTTKDGTSAYDLVKSGEKFNFKSFGLRGRVEDIKREYFPVIAHVIKDAKYQHFVVVYDILSNKKQLIVADPASSGIKKIKIEDFNKISTDEYLIFVPNGKILNIKKNDRFYKIITNFFHQNIFSLVVILILSLIFTILTIISTFYLQFLMNKVLPNNWYKKFATLPLVFLSINILKIVCHFFRINILAKLIQKFDFYLNKNIYNRLFLLPDSYYENRTTGEVVSRVTDLENIKSVIANILLDGIISSLLSFFSLAILFKINVKLTLLVCILVVLESIICIIFKDKIRCVIFNLKEESAKIYSYLTDTIKEIISIKHLYCNKFLENIYKEKYYKYLKTYYSYQKYLNLENSFMNLITGLLNILVISLGYYYVLVNKLDISFLLVFLFLYPYFLEPFNQFFRLFANIEDVKEAFNRVNEFYQVEEDVKISSSNTRAFDKLLLENINYHYRPERIVLNNLNLEVKKGERLLIFGKSGSGKTTLIKIIAGYLNGYDGRILINGNSNLGIVDFLRKRVTYIRQGDSLLNMSLKDNILLGRDIGENEFFKVCQLLRIDKFANKNTMNYDMQIGENGENLSAGEKQRVLIARGILKEGDIYIFDECLSNLDIKLEREILENIFDYLREKTVIVVSHRFYNEDLFTRKVELKKGEVYG